MEQNIIELRNINLEIEELKARKAAIKKAALEHRDSIPDEELTKSTQDIVDINNKIKYLEERKKTFQKEERTVNMNENFLTINNQEVAELMEQRGADLRAGKAVTYTVEKRTMTLDAGGAIVETKYSRDLTKKPIEISTLIDRVNAVPLQGGNSYTKGFEKTGAEGDYTTEIGDYYEDEPSYDYTDIAKAKITVYCEISKDFEVLPNVDYANLIQVDMRNALRKKITKQIVNGLGGTNKLLGIFNAPAKCIPVETDVAVNAIDETTLNNIVFALGGDEDVAENGVLILSKSTLQLFANVRNSDKKSIYKITKSGNTGTIGYVDGGIEVDYILNSACGNHSIAATNEYTMAYGLLSTYELPLFSDIKVEKSSDYKFKQGMTCYRGEVFVGGSVAGYKTFVRVKKSA